MRFPERYYKAGFDSFIERMTRLNINAKAIQRSGQGSIIFKAIQNAKSPKVKLEPYSAP
jgi:hypothetical protein